MSNGESISITLSPAQVDQVVRAAAQGSAPSFSALISTTLNAQWLTADDKVAAPPDGEHGDKKASDTAGYFPSYDDTRLSRSLMRGLSILTCFGPDNRERGIIELATQLGMSPSTTHRYVVTLVELGLLERSPRSRKYRLARVLEVAEAQVPAGKDDGGSATNSGNTAGKADLADDGRGAPVTQPVLDD